MTDTYLTPPFRITRISHVVMRVRDLDASVRFYTGLAGLVETTREDGAAYLRGIEETSHHSLVLIRDDTPSCDCLGFRVLADSDLDAAEAYFAALGVSTEWTQRLGQGRTLRVDHPSGLRLELTATMTRVPRTLTDYAARKGGAVLRLNHAQVIVPDVDGTGSSFEAMGFRAAEVIRQADTGQRIGLFLHRKNDPHDLVLALGAGPRLHHFSYIVGDLQAMFRACDIAGEMGCGSEVERGPGRHGPGNSAFVYFRDPDGHRIEFILPPMQFMDADEPTAVWSTEEKHKIVPWGQPAPQRWREEATSFTGVQVSQEGALARWVAT